MHESLLIDHHHPIWREEAREEEEIGPDLQEDIQEADLDHGLLEDVIEEEADLGIKITDGVVDDHVQEIVAE